MPGRAYASDRVSRHCAGSKLGGGPSKPMVGVRPMARTWEAQLSAVNRPPASVNVVSNTPWWHASSSADLAAATVGRRRRRLAERGGHFP